MIGLVLINVISLSLGTAGGIISTATNTVLNKIGSISQDIQSNDGSFYNYMYPDNDDYPFACVCSEDDFEAYTKGLITKVRCRNQIDTSLQNAIAFCDPRNHLISSGINVKSGSQQPAANGTTPAATKAQTPGLPAPRYDSDHDGGTIHTDGHHPEVVHGDEGVHHNTTSEDPSHTVTATTPAGGKPAGSAEAGAGTQASAGGASAGSGTPAAATSGTEPAKAATTSTPNNQAAGTAATPTQGTGSATGTTTTGGTSGGTSGTTTSTTTSTSGKTT